MEFAPSFFCAITAQKSGLRNGFRCHMSIKEATARIKINKLLEAAGWRFFATGSGPANIQPEPSVALTQRMIAQQGLFLCPLNLQNTFMENLTKWVSR